MAEPSLPAWRTIPPARSPVAPTAVLAAVSRSLSRLGDTAESEREVRRWLAEEFGAERCVLTDSGTSALTLALRVAFRRSKREHVALPAYACYDVATAAAGAGADVSFYDLVPETLAPELSSLEAALRGGPRTVVLVHLYGYPVDVSRVRALASRFDAHVIEDAAQGVGGTLEGRPLGAHGDLSVLSFGRGKGRTSGAGGALLARSPESARLLADEAGGMSTGRRRPGWKEGGVALAQWALGRPELYRLPAALPFLDLGATVYRRPHPPEAMSVVAAEILRRNHGEPDPQENDRRRRRAERLRECLAAVDGVQVIEPDPAGDPGYLRFPVLLSRHEGGEARLGILPGYPKLLEEIGPFRSYLVDDLRPSPGATRLRDELVTLPTHGFVADEDLERIVAWVRDRAADS